MVKVHPENCTCNMCKRKKKAANKETRRVVGSIFLIFIIAFLFV